MNTISLIDSAWRDLKHGARLLRLNPAIRHRRDSVARARRRREHRDLPAARRGPHSHAAGRKTRSSWSTSASRIRPNGRTGGFIGRRPMLTNPLFEQIRERQQAFSGLAAWGIDAFNMTTSGEARYAHGLWVNGDFFNTLGVTPLVGRLLTPDDDRRGCRAPAGRDRLRLLAA